MCENYEEIIFTIKKTRKCRLDLCGMICAVAEWYGIYNNDCEHVVELLYVVIVTRLCDMLFTPVSVAYYSAEARDH